VSGPAREGLLAETRQDQGREEPESGASGL